MEESDRQPIPDFALDAEVLSAYAQARTKYLLATALAAEELLRIDFEKRRARIRAEIDSADYLRNERIAVAEAALWNYALLYPLRVVNDKPAKPSIWEFIRSLGYALRMYKRAVLTAADVVQAQSRRRRLEASEEELQRQFERTVYLQDEARKKQLDLPQGLAAFHAQPGVADLCARVDEIAAERARFARRLAAGEVSDTERRDRDFAEAGISPLEPPCTGIAVVRVARYGDLTYVIFRDLEHASFALPYVPRLERLIDNVVDVYRHGETFRVRATAGPTGRPMTLAEHVAATIADRAEANAEFRRIRLELSLPRTDLPPMPLRRTLDASNDEADLIELLLSFVGTGEDPQAEPTTEAAESEEPARSD